MSSSEDMLTSFMDQENKKNLGEKVKDENTKINDNRLPEKQKAQYYDIESNNSDAEKAVLAAKKAMGLLMSIPLILGGFLSFLYIVSYIVPTIFSFLKKFFLLLV